jgi:hypothetical protein
VNDFRACASTMNSQAKQACEQAAMQRFSMGQAASGGINRGEARDGQREPRAVGQQRSSW